VKKKFSKIQDSSSCVKFIPLHQASSCCSAPHQHGTHWLLHAHLYPVYHTKSPLEVASFFFFFFTTQVWVSQEEEQQQQDCWRD
jgi:hypothetical protein